MLAQSGKLFFNSLIAFALVFLLSCGDDDVVDPGGGGNGSVTKTIGPGGGSISANGITLEILAGALAGESEVTVKPVSGLPPTFSGTGIDSLGESAVTILSTLAMSLPGRISINRPGTAALVPRASQPGIVTITGAFIAADPNGVAQLLPGLVSQHDLTTGVSTVIGDLDLSGGVSTFAGGAISAGPVSATVVFGTFKGLSFVIDGIPASIPFGQTFTVKTSAIATEENTWTTETASWRDATVAPPLGYTGKVPIQFDGILNTRKPGVISVNSAPYGCVANCTNDCMPLRMIIEFTGAFGLPFGTWTAEIVADVECTPIIPQAQAE